jgi:hypothetical protein
MASINVGAYVDGKRPVSKAALKRALADAPESVEFDTTSMFDGGAGPYSGTELPVGVTLSVVGPDPYTRRNWYGTIVRNARTGKVTVS